jgi:CXXX repeat modification system protein
MTGKQKRPSVKPVGTITQPERDEIRELFERKVALAELFKTLTDVDKEENGKLYDKLVKDMADTASKYQRWFDEKSRLYGWENVPGGHWQINFDTCEVFLMK